MLCNISADSIVKNDTIAEKKTLHFIYVFLLSNFISGFYIHFLKHKSEHVSCKKSHISFDTNISEK